MQGIEQKYWQFKRFFALPWSAQAIQRRNQLTDIDPRLGSPSFQILWGIEKKQKTPRDLLRMLLDLLDFSELTGEMAQTRKLIAGIYPELPPDSPFWWEIAELVNQAFPNNRLSQEDEVARQVHQLRYVISSHHAEYVRKHFRRGNMTDTESLVSYLKNRSYDVSESARLHNKLAFSGNKATFPDNQVSHNIKILQHFHTEFILSSSGGFLNEIDPEQATIAGIVNGASFNYARQNGKRHWELDIAPVSKHDPTFRQEIRRHFRAPTMLEYKSPESVFARQGRSCFALVRKEIRRFSKLIKR